MDERKMSTAIITAAAMINGQVLFILFCGSLFLISQTQYAKKGPLPRLDGGFPSIPT
jgi:hypothetical protein